MLGMLIYRLLELGDGTGGGGGSNSQAGFAAQKMEFTAFGLRLSLCSNSTKDLEMQPSKGNNLPLDSSRLSHCYLYPLSKDLMTGPAFSR